MFILIWVPSIREHYASFCSWFLVSLVTDTACETFLSTLLSLLITLAFPKSRIKLGKQGIFDFLEKPRPAIELTSSIKGNTLFVKTWLYIANAYHDVSQWAYSWRSDFSFACFSCLWSQFLLFWVTTTISTGIKNSLLLINPWLRKLKPVNIPNLFSRSTTVCCSIKIGSKGWSETTLHK